MIANSMKRKPKKRDWFWMYWDCEDDFVVIQLSAKKPVKKEDGRFECDPEKEVAVCARLFNRLFPHAKIVPGEFQKVRIIVEVLDLKGKIRSTR